MEREYKLQIKIYCITKGHIMYHISNVVTVILVVNMERSCTPKRTHMSYLLIWDWRAMATVQWTWCLSLTSLARSVPSSTVVFGIPSFIFTFSVHNGINTVHHITWLVFIWSIKYQSAVFLHREYINTSLNIKWIWF